MTWSVVTPDGAEGTTAAMVEKPCILEYGRIIATFDRVDDALKAASAVNATEEALEELRLASAVEPDEPMIRIARFRQDRPT